MFDRFNIKQISDELTKIIKAHVKVSGRLSGQMSLFSDQASLNEKIDLLERILEITRIENKYLENNLPTEEFLQGILKIDRGTLRFDAPKKIKNLGSGTSPIRLQPKLLLFLLFIHNRGSYKVYDIIDRFIRIIWDHLDPLDFKKTRTGVTRCFTNTRFAANTLRRYGLLKFTRKEAYKTWALSLPGILVASKVMEKADWAIPHVQRELNFDLHPDILKAFDELKSYDSFVRRLTSICKPDNKLFVDFKKASIKAYSLLGKYWDILQNPSLSKKDREKESQAQLERIEKDSEIKKFYDAFSTLVNVGDLLSLK